MSQLLTVADRFEIADLVARYAAAVDDREFEKLRPLFVADCTLDTGRSVRSGIDEVVAAMQGLLRYVATSHMIGQQLVEIASDGATGLTYCTAHHLSDNGDHRTDKVMHIRYHDRFVRVGRGWQISVRRLEVPWTEERVVR